MGGKDREGWGGVVSAFYIYNVHFFVFPWLLNIYVGGAMQKEGGSKGGQSHMSLKQI